MTAPSDYCKVFFSLLLLPPPPSFSFLNLTAFVCFVKIIQIVILDAHFFWAVLPCCCGFPDGASGKEPASQCRRRKRHRFNPWVRKMPWGGHGNPLQYSCPENPHGQRSLVGQSHAVTQSWTRLKQLTMHHHMPCFYLDISPCKMRDRSIIN